MLQSDSNGRWGPIEWRTAESVRFDADGYTSKSFTSSLPPPLVRMLEDRLTGYQDRLYYRPGDLVRVYWQSSGHVTPRLYRHGINKVLITEWGLQEPQTQSIPDGYFVDGGCGWKPCLEYVIPDSARPGIFSLDLSNTAGERFAIPFTVVSSSRTTALLVLASTTTWLAYNFWGGRSRYRSAENSLVVHPVPAPGGPPAGARIRGAIASCLPASLVDFIRFRILGRKRVDDSWKWRPLSATRPFPHCALECDEVANPFINHLAGAERHWAACCRK